MPIPDTPKEQLDLALTEAWDAAEKCKSLLESNNGSSAAYWAAAATSWATIAEAIATRLKG